MKATKIIFDKSNSKEVQKGYVIDNYINETHNLGFSLVRSHLNGEHPLMKNINSSKTYYIIRGQGTFFVNNEQINVKASDVIIIPKNTKYKFNGKFSAILISSPAFNPKDDIFY